MPHPVPFGAPGVPGTPARTIKTRMQRRSSNLPLASPAARRISSSPVKPRVLFPHRGRSSLNTGSTIPPTPGRASASGVSMRRSRGRQSGWIGMETQLETLDDQEEQPWWDEIGEDVEPDSGLVERLVEALREQRTKHAEGRQEAKQTIVAREKSCQDEMQDAERMFHLQLQEKDRRLQEALEVAEDEFTSQERILSATQRDNERLMIQIGLLQEVIDDSAYALAEAYGQEEWQGILAKAAAERRGQAEQRTGARVSFGLLAPGEPIHRAIKARSFVLHGALPAAAHSAEFEDAQLPSSDPDVDESEVSMLLQPHPARAPAQEDSFYTPPSFGPPQRLTESALPIGTPKRRSRVSNMTAVTAPMPPSTPYLDTTFNTADREEDMSIAVGEAGVHDLQPEGPEPVQSAPPQGENMTLESMRLALLGLQRELALDKYSREEYLELADGKMQALETFMADLAAGRGITMSALRL